MRILQIHNSYQQRGGEDAVVQLERDLLLSRGHEVEQLVVSNEEIRTRRDRLLTALRTSSSPTGRELAARALARVRPDVVHVHNTFPLLSPSVYDACADAGVPVVQTLHNFRTICAGALLLRDGKVCELCIGGEVRHAVRHGCYRSSPLATIPVAHLVSSHRRRRTWHTKVARFIALTNFARDKFIEAGFPAERIAVKPNFCPDRGATECPGRQGALYVGRLSAEKGIDTLVEAWANVDVPLTIVGDGPLRSLPTPGRVKFVGPKSAAEVSVLMSRAQFIVVPSRSYEGFPMVVAEAFSRGLPVLAARIGSLEEIVSDGCTGLHFDPGSRGDLAAKARWMMERRAACASMGRNARHEYELKYTPERNYGLLLRTYEEIVG